MSLEQHRELESGSGKLGDVTVNVDWETPGIRMELHPVRFFRMPQEAIQKLGPESENIVWSVSRQAFLAGFLIAVTIMLPVLVAVGLYL